MIVTMMIVVVMMMMFVKKMMTMEIFLLITFYGIAGCGPCRCTSIESPRIAFQLVMMWMMMMLQMMTEMIIFDAESDGNIDGQDEEERTVMKRMVVTMRLNNIN